LEHPRKTFFDLHVKFEELYNDSQLKIDMIAERVLTLGGTLHTFEDYIKHNKIVVGKIFQMMKSSSTNCGFIIASANHRKSNFR
jgi:DNA-binding ferritin-like protein